MVEDKDLSPEDRIKKLKKLKAEKEKEIAEAQQLIKESEDELTDKANLKEKIPIPESAKEDLEGLSKEAKEILKVQKGLKEKVEESEDEIKKVEEIEDDLEALAAQKVDLPPDVVNSEYAMHLSKEPMREIYQEMTGISKAVEEKGYISKEEERRVEYLTSAVEKKLEAEHLGKYSFSEDVAMAANITKQLGASLMNTYNANKTSSLYRSS